MTKGYFGSKSPSWKGGRTVASNGYVLLNVGREHPLADIRGYAYEHRIVAQEKVGRPLRAGELVHHIDGNKQNNDPANLEVVMDIAEHLVRHRSENSTLRLPGEDNPIIACECGCGTTFQKYDSSRRARKYISGHNSWKGGKPNG